MKSSAQSTLAIILAAAGLGTSHAETKQSISVILSPTAKSGEIASVGVTETFVGYSADAGEVLFTVPARVATTKGQDYKAGEVRAIDGAGPLPLKMAIVPAPAGQPLELRTFASARSTTGTITLRYRAKVTPAMTPRIPGPSYDLRGADGGFGGAFFSFLLLPANPAGPAQFDFNWDLGALPPGARGVSTMGDGHVAARIDPAEINTIFFLGGNVHGFAPEKSPLKVYWIGNPPFDTKESAAWTAASYESLRSFFRDPEAGNYTFLMRPFPLPRDGGGATRGGFMLEYGTGKLSDASHRMMFTHEMVHHFVGSLDGDSGTNAWFGEGLAEFFKARLPYRSGLLDLQSAAKEFAIMTNAYYTSPFVSVPMVDVGKLRWADRSIQGVPYNRGFVYFVDLNAKIVKRSNGKRSLDDLVLAMLERRRAGQSYDLAAWRNLIRSGLGEPGVADLNRMLEGKLIIPPPNAFGDCFRRVRISTNRPVLGFEENSILAEPHVVSGLQANSAAAAAGLRDGDRILSSSGIIERIAHSASNVQLEPTAHLTIERAGATIPISFSTAGPPVTEYRWELVGDRSKTCRVP
jgi:hypothetical protein